MRKRREGATYSDDHWIGTDEETKGQLESQRRELKGMNQLEEEISFVGASKQPVSSSIEIFLLLSLHYLIRE